MNKKPKITTEQLKAISTSNINVFNELYKIKNEQGLPLDFHNHLFQFDIYNDFSPEQSCMKAAQIGFSTMAINKSLWLAKYKKMDIIYTLPTQGDVYDFVGGKVNRIVAQNPIMQDFVKDRDTFEQKRVGENVIYYRGTFTSRAALMVSSDLNIHDELDRSKQDVVEQYASRLQHSKYQWEWNFSNPSAEGHGVSKSWERSDQKHWFIKCSKCSKRQYMSWPESFNMDIPAFICKHCHKELSPEDRRVGGWIKKFKDKPVSGYWIPLFIAPWVKAEKVRDLFNEKTEEYFYNFVLGLPYAGSGNKVSEDTILKNLTSEVNTQEGRIVIGVDTGAKIHLVCGNKQGLFYQSEDSDYQDLERLMNRWPKSIVVIDQGGDLIMPRKLREKYRGRVFLCTYSEDRKTMQLVRWGKKHESGAVIADRNRMIQLVIDEFTDKRIQLQGTENDWHEYIQHWKNIYRTSEENNLGVMKRKWERSGADHLVHATVYWRVGMDKFGGGDGLIFTPEDGSSRFPNAPTVELDGTIRTKIIK